jgi:ATP/maltotriose-dependent transcriptional regulator MalT
MMAQVWQMIYEADPAQTADLLDRALSLTLKANDPVAFNAVAPLLNLHPAFLPNGIDRLERYCREVLARFGDGSGLLQACTHSTLSYTQMLSGSMEPAFQEAEKALAITRRIGNYPFSEGQAHYVLGVCMAVRGNHAGLAEHWTALLPWVEQTPAMQRFLVAILYVIGRAAWIQHKFDQARQVEARIATIINPAELPEVTDTRCLMHALVAISDRRYDDAESALRPALQIEKRVKHAKFFGSAQTLLAYLNLQKKKKAVALAQFEVVLAGCMQARMPGIILQETAIAVPLLHLAVEHRSYADFAQGLLDQLSACDSPRPVAIPETGQSLTPRETEVLKLIVEGASNQGIADQLVISSHTVKVHITNIYAKLQVTSRTQAIARTHELHLL